MQLGKHITLAQATYSWEAKRRGIDNTAPSSLLPAARLLVENVYDPLCDMFNLAIPFNSFYRTAVLNKAIKGSKGSQHVKFEAIDLDDQGLAKFQITNAGLFIAIKTHLKFDQLIWEFGNDENPDWVHVSYKAIGNRNEILRSNRVKTLVKSKTVYKTVYTKIA
jgi:hypothetical protein